MKKILVTFTLIASFAVLLTQCKEEEESNTNASGTPANNSSSDFVKLGSSESTALNYTNCLFDGTYDMAGSERADSNNSGAFIIFSFKAQPSAGTYKIKNLSDTSELKTNECEVYAAKNGTIAGAIGGNVTVTTTNGKLRATATNLPGINLSSEPETISGSIGCK
jgi:hypothetical protein